MSRTSTHLPHGSSEHPRARLAELGFALGAPRSGPYAYDPVAEAHGVAFVSGQIPKWEGSVVYTGAVPHGSDLAEAIAAAELCAVNALEHIDHSIGLDRVERLLKLTVYVASAPEFDDQPAVAEGASLLLRAVLGEAGRHARTAIGVPRLPKNATVEIDLALATSPGPTDPTAVVR
ncbi:RidA family protein [Leucobacter tardus]|uniref:RidA family protein n=1 Tax=Leucobacter tardus TaxID=501483 RepID=A0A939QE25_9MICO|nr:RidA family protein [Leucobacter tardus]MBO2990097.1 RidA family protein [Leucobacter tardus]